jgi:hypothetical protein
LTFFFDNNLSPRLVSGLRGFGEDVVHLKDVFAPDMPDEAWIPQIGSRGWFLVSRDKRIARDPAKIRALKEAGVGAFFFTQKKDPHLWEWVEMVVRRWTEIKRWADSRQRPFVVGIPERGHLRFL